MKRLLWISAAILAGALVLNNILGGFQEVEATIIKVDGYTIYGQPFQGNYDSDQLTDIVDYTRELLDEGTLAGDLVIVNYFNFKQEKRGFVDQFIGVRLEEGDMLDIEGFELRQIETKQAVEVVIGIRKLVMPSPEKIKNKAEEMANDQGLQLQDLSIETYQKEELVIHIPVN